MAEGLSPAERIRRRTEYQQIYDHGTRCQSRLFTIFVAANGRPVARIGIAATKKLGGAATRNRAKRMVRETFRRHKPAAGLDVVVIPRREMLDAPLSVLEAEYQSILARCRPRAVKR